MGDHPLAEEPTFVQDFAATWRAKDKVVYSKTLEAVSTARTRVERDFDPAAVRQLKAAARRDLTIGGPELAGRAFKAGLVDEVHLFLAPILVGGGTHSLPHHVRLGLELLDDRRRQRHGLRPLCHHVVTALPDHARAPCVSIASSCDGVPGTLSAPGKAGNDVWGHVAWSLGTIAVFGLVPTAR